MTNIDSARVEAEKLLEGGKWFNADGPLYKMMVERVAQALAALMVERDAEWNKALETAAQLFTHSAGVPYFVMDKIRALRRPDAPANTEMAGEGDGWTGKTCPHCDGVGEHADGSRCNKCGGTGDEHVSATPTTDELRAKVVKAAIEYVADNYGDQSVGENLVLAVQALQSKERDLGN